MMEKLSKRELEEALPPITSMISKCEKAQVKMMEGTSQHSLLRNRIKALRVAEILIHQALKNHNPHDPEGLPNE